MKTETVIQALAAVAALTSQLAPLFTQLQAAIASQDEARVSDLLSRLQAVNDRLGQA